MVSQLEAKWTAKDWNGIVRSVNSFFDEFDMDRRGYEFLVWRGSAYYQLGNDAEALGDMKRAFSLMPEYPSAASYLAWILATSPDSNVRNAAASKMAVPTLKRASDRQSQEAYAAVLAANGEYEEAYEIQSRVAEAQSETTSSTAKVLAELYKSRVPYIDHARVFAGATSASPR